MYRRLRDRALSHGLDRLNVASAVLLSGGVDSIAIAFWKRPEVVFTLDYGQAPANAEIHAAEQVCSELGIRHEILRIDCSSLGSGDLANSPALSIAPVPEWWPFRNQLLVTLAAARAVACGVERLLLGTVVTDRAHADGSPLFVSALSSLMNMQEGGIVVEAPAIELSSAELVRTSDVPVGLLAWAHSCHVGNLACGRCRGCAKHFTTMRELGFDPY
jgi:7-cyano-7-deazaguanine synthase